MRFKLSPIFFIFMSLIMACSDTTNTNPNASDNQQRSNESLLENEINPKNKSFDELNSECDYVNETFNIIEYIRKQLKVEISSNINLSNLNEKQKEDLCHNIVLTEMLKREIKDRTRRYNRKTSLSKLYYSKLKICDKFYEMKSIQDKLEDNLRNGELVKFIHTIPKKISNRFPYNFDDYLSNVTEINLYQSEEQEANENISGNAQETIGDNKKRYYIEDEDGWTNLRSKPKGKIIKRINNFEIGTEISQNGDWIQLKFDDNSIGYIHKSRLELAP